MTKCLYSKPRKSSVKTIDVLLKSIGFFDVKNVWLPSNLKSLREQIQIEHPSIEIHKKPYDFVFIDASEIEAHYHVLLEDMHNDSLLLVDSIYKNQTNTTLWEKIKRDKKARVTVDMFHCGAVFFRKEQAVEDFKIRI